MYIIHIIYKSSVLFLSDLNVITTNISNIYNLNRMFFTACVKITGLLLLEVPLLTEVRNHHINLNFLLDRLEHLVASVAKPLP